MLNLIRKMFGGGTNADFAALVKAGAQVVDVRSRPEYQSGHIRGSINIPLAELSRQLNKIDRNKPVVVCCASGMRSASAKAMLSEKGYHAFNGGGWMSLERKINSKA